MLMILKYNMKLGLGEAKLFGFEKETLSETKKKLS